MQQSPDLEDRPRVLIVDDEKFIRDILADFLGMEGYGVRTAQDGVAALQEIAQTRYDLIISDLKMPHMDGIQLFDALGTTYPEMSARIMFVTGDVVGTDAERFLAESGCRWLAKPFRLNELLRIARELIREP